MGTLIFGALLMLGGLASLFFGVRVALRQRVLVRTGLKAQGVIVLVETTETSSRGEPEATAYYPTFEFRGADGTLHRVRQSSGTLRSKAYRVGQATDVIYLPGREDAATMHSFAGVWLLPVMFCAMGAVMLVGGFVLLTNGDQPNAAVTENHMFDPGTASALAAYSLLCPENSCIAG